MHPDQPLFGAIEAGGTKFLCAIGTAGGEILEQTRIDTRDPGSTIAEVLQFFAHARSSSGSSGSSGPSLRPGRPLQALGVAAFGPLELRRDSPRYGFITNTPKPGWRDTNLLGPLKQHFAGPIGFDTDVNAAALAERRWGAGQGLESLIYVTVGTGIGGGVIHHGLPVHGLMHPEIGHIPVRRHPADADFPGVCPFHHDCLEGMASGPAITARTGRSLAQSGVADAIWDIEADYLGQLAAQLVLMHSPQRILFGGGVMQQQRLLPAIQARMLHWLHDYLPLPELRAREFVSAAGLAGAAGIKGALALAIDRAALECSGTLHNVSKVSIR
jgi:fructokinase